MRFFGCVGKLLIMHTNLQNRNLVKINFKTLEKEVLATTIQNFDFGNFRTIDLDVGKEQMKKKRGH